MFPKFQRARLKKKVMFNTQKSVYSISALWMQENNRKQGTAALPLFPQYLCVFKEEKLVHSASIFCSNRFILKLVSSASHFVTASFRLLSKGKDHAKRSQYWWSTLFTFYTHIFLLPQTKVTGVLPQDAILNISSAQTSSSFTAIDLPEIPRVWIGE
jgi:hypothetical protein